MSTSFPVAQDVFPVKVPNDVALSSEWNNHSSAIEALEATLLGPTIYNVRGYGAAGNGVADDTAAIQSAINACGAAGGGIVFVPEGTYKVNVRTTSGGLAWCLYIAYDNVVIMGAGPGTIFDVSPASAAALFFHGGHLKAARIAGDYTQWFGHQALEYADVAGSGSTVYPMTGSYVTGVTSVTLTTPSDAGNFAVDDWVIIRTGQTLAARLGQPDGEYNRVKSINTGTGVLTLHWPTAKPYQPENFNSGAIGISSPTGVGSAAPYGVANVTARLMYGPWYRDFTIVQHGAYHPFIGGYNVGGVFDHVDVIVAGQGFASTGAHMRQRISHCSAMVTGGTDGDYFVSADTCSTDPTFEDNEFVADAAMQFHVNEGVNRATIARNHVLLPSVAGDFHVVAQRARGWDMVVSDNYFSGGGDTSMIYADTTVAGSGTVAGNVLRNRSTPYAIAIDASGAWAVGNNATNGLKVVVNSATVLAESRFPLPPGAWKIIANATDALTGNSLVCWSMAAGVNSFIGTAFTVPRDWVSYDVYVHWTNLGGGSGNVTFGLQEGGENDGDAQVVDRTTGATDAAPLINVLKVTKVNADGVIAVNGKLEHFLFLNRDNSAGLANAIGVTCVEIRRAG